jgi:hypothetical protein
MAKKEVAISLRKPKQADAPAESTKSAPRRPFDVEAFVDGDATRTAPTRATYTASPSPVADRMTITLHLPSNLASRLMLRCIEDDRDVSNVVGELVSSWLDGKSREPELTMSSVGRWLVGRLRRVSFMRFAFG